MTQTTVNKNKQNILNKEFVILDKQKGSVKFTDSELNDAALLLAEQMEAYEAEQRELLHQVIRVSQTFLEVN